MDFTITITGTATLLMHNSRLANPLDPATKALKSVTSKRGKTDENHEEIARLEHAGSLYFDDDIGPYIPADNIWRALFDGAKKSKRGPRIKEGVFITTDVNPLAYDGPRTIDGLWADENFRHIASVKVGTSRTMRCRPQFRNWRCRATGILDTEILDLAELREIADTAGSLIGLGDWRPRYGRFTATIEEA
ncbi:hypothetical protein [Planomonospora venezuelensis]|uniref:Uncharacterized protein n=1 Tax=Planomonospora venezuelensis TaxID=1999 RepID=A0A841D9R9_PLAVE|nr:hypothetical protein [Planomonospora venezuelensis]MBB5965068.1 hypothetical protein [Planomonospora venezuelensis]GIN05015.1 hypothetical protein Pve01_66730 [Planomonospora venezuelensis]